MHPAIPEVDAILDGLNPQQRDAVLSTEGPLLIVAGAGSGKTNVLTRRIAYLIAAKRVAPWSILAITFTNKAAREMRDRMERLIGPFAADVSASTFHSFCVRVLRRDSDRLGLNSGFTVLDDADQVATIKRILTDQNVDTKRFEPRAVKSAISAAKNILRGPAKVKDDAVTPFERVVGDAYLEYERRLKTNHSLDFDDLIMKTVRLFEQEPDVLAFYQNKYHYLHVDEYQDTNHAQYKLVNLLAQKRKNLCVVGDSDQSIYGWRGADIQNILQFERDYPQAQVIRLEQNYRSTKRILTIANEVIRNNMERKAKNLWTNNEEGEKAVLFRAADERVEANYVVNQIESLQANHRQYRDFSILYRTNAQSRVLEEALLQRGIPYRIFGGLKFYERKEIKDVLAYLRLIANPADDISLLRVLNVPKRGIGDGTVDKLQRFADSYGLSLYEALPQADQAGAKGKILAAITEFATLIDSLVKMSEFVTVTELTEEILKRSGYRQTLKAEKSLEAESRLENLDEFLTVTQEFENRWQGDSTRELLAEFLSEVALVADTDLNGGKVNAGMPTDDNQVVLMTLHSAKGLEFPVVFITGFEEGIFPHSRTLFNESEIEEERRLCYVGVTRARERLFMTACSARMIFGEYRHYTPSRFLAEMPKEHIEAELPQSAAPTRLAWQPRAESSGRRPEANDVARSYDYKAGDKVEHRKWGIGTVIEVHGEAEDVELVIAFPAPNGLKRLLARFAPIEKMPKES